MISALMQDTPVQPIPEIFGLVLAGGRSRRFGQDKAAQSFEGQSFLERAVGILAQLLDEVWVSVRADQSTDELRSRFQLIPDATDSMGPGSGLISAHRHCPEAAWLVVACDMPLLTPEVLQRLLLARNPEQSATAYRSSADNLPEPLCAIYEPATLARFERQSAGGQAFSPRKILTGMDVVLLPPPDANELLNINTPADFARLSGQ
jgi:molybdopterin-guanine dinucleotide biosynthesis protein A